MNEGADDEYKNPGGQGFLQWASRERCASVGRCTDTWSIALPLSNEVSVDFYSDVCYLIGSLMEKKRRKSWKALGKRKT